MFSNGIYNKIHDLSHYNPLVQRAIIALVNSRPFVKNPLYSYFYSKQMKMLMEKYEFVPSKVIIENTNACNSDCIFCTHNQMTRKKGFMNFQLFKKIIDDCTTQGVREVAIYRLGEPLLDTQFSEKITYAKKAGIEIVSTNTNASLLDEENATKILDSDIDVIYISLDASSKAVYEGIRRGLNYDVVERNVMKFIELRNNRGRKARIILHFCITQENRNQVKDFIRKWKNSVDQICIADTHDWSGNIEIKDKRPFQRNGPCKLPWTEMVISWDGKVPLCCVDYNDTVVLGDLTNESIKDVWGGEKLKKYRKIHINKDFDKIPICKNCTCNFSWWMRE